MPTIKRKHPLFSAIFLALFYNNKRWQYKFDGIDDYISIPPITLEGDFEISLTARADTSGNYMSLGNTLSEDTWGFYYYIGGNRVTTRFALDLGNIININSNFLPSVGEDVEYLLKRTGSLVELYINGVLQGSSYTIVSGLTVDLIGCHSSSRFEWSGVIKNVYFKDLSNPSNSRLYKINDGWDNTPVIKDSLGNGSTDGVAQNFQKSGWIKR